MPGWLCWFWWLASPYWHPYARCFWRLYPWFPLASRRALMHGPLLFALPQMTREQEISLLEWRRSLIQQELDYVNKRLEELRK
ncbi:MAG: DUF5320 domain-containing protein [Thermoproteota archaeon]|nr:DUF5320 domain-containing protein [Candidatus Brockarchaeota archaeon]